MAHRPTYSDAYALSPRAFGLSADTRVIALRFATPTLEPGTDECWVHLAYVDSWEGHPSGPFAFTQEIFDEIIRNAERKNTPIPFYYGHPDHSSGQPIPKAGKILKLELRGDDLYALVRWTAKAARMLRDGEYEHCSAVVVFSAIDPKTGKPTGAQLFEAGLTDTPFLDDQEPIKLSRRALAAGGTMDPEKMIAGVTKALGIEPNTPKERVLEMLSSIFDFVAAMTGKTAKQVEDEAGKDEKAAEQVVDAAARIGKAIKLAMPEPTAPPSDAPTQLADNSADVAAGTALLEKLTAASGLDAAALLTGIESNLDAIVAMLKGEPASGTPSDTQTMQLSAVSARLAASDKRIVDLSAKLEAYERREVEAKAKAAEQRIDSAIESGHILEDAKPFFVKLAAKMPEEFDKQLEAAAKRPAVPTKRVINEAPQNAGPDKPQNDAEKKFFSAIPAHVDQGKRVALLHRFRENMKSA